MWDLGGGIGRLEASSLTTNRSTSLRKVCVPLATDPMRINAIGEPGFCLAILR
jgi:hypothetical protein